MSTHEDEMKGLFKSFDSEYLKSKRRNEKKIGNLRIDPVTGQTTYKNTPSSVLSRSLQKGISFSVGKMTEIPERDVLLKDFEAIETYMFNREVPTTRMNIPLDKFTFHVYAPAAFRYFRDLFGIKPNAYMLSINQPLREINNSGASGSLFFKTSDDEYIIKTVQTQEAIFLQKLLPGYYMNLVQNPQTLLPKFYGLYCMKCKGKDIRVVVMNNLIPTKLKMHLQFDLKGSTYKRVASVSEKAKKKPVYKDLDLERLLPDGLVLDPIIYSAFLKTLKRDCLVLESFQIMDYSLLVAIHKLDPSQPQKAKFSDKLRKSASTLMMQAAAKKEAKQAQSSLRLSIDNSAFEKTTDESSEEEEMLNLQQDYMKRKAILSSTIMNTKFVPHHDLWSGGLPARSPKGELLMVFVGIIDILQNYRLIKKVEHFLKSIVADSATVSVNKPSFYSSRFQEFIANHLFVSDPNIKQSWILDKVAAPSVLFTPPVSNGSQAGAASLPNSTSVPSTTSSPSLGRASPAGPFLHPQPKFQKFNYFNSTLQTSTSTARQTPPEAETSSEFSDITRNRAPSVAKIKLNQSVTVQGESQKTESVEETAHHSSHAPSVVKIKLKRSVIVQGESQKTESVEETAHHSSNSPSVAKIKLNRSVTVQGENQKTESIEETAHHSSNAPSVAKIKLNRSVTVQGENQKTESIEETAHHSSNAPSVAKIKLNRSVTVQGESQKTESVEETAHHSSNAPSVAKIKLKRSVTVQGESQKTESVEETAHHSSNAPSVPEIDSNQSVTVQGESEKTESVKETAHHSSK